jgi:Amt family ammonium transporter
VIAGLAGFWACTWLKHRFNDNDSLDVFGVHGIGGLTGTLLAGSLPQPPSAGAPV